MDCYKLCTAVSHRDALESRQSEECCNGCPTLLDVVFEQTFAGYDLSNIRIVLTKALPAIVLIVLISVTEMVRN